MGLFNYDSKLMQTLGFIADLFVCNLLFLIFCLPVVTIGAAFSGLHYSMRTLADTQDDRSAIKQFFIGFKSGFLSVTLVWFICLTVIGILTYTTYVSFVNSHLGIFVPWGVPFACLCVVLVYTSTLTVFHSQFGCTAGQLLRNGVPVIILSPIRSLLSAALTWAPMILALTRFDLFLYLTPLFLTVWFSTAFMLISLMMRKPFRLLIDHHTGQDVIDEENRRKAREEEDEIEAEAKANLAARKTTDN